MALDTLIITFIAPAALDEEIDFNFYALYPDTSTVFARDIRFKTVRVNPGEATIGTDANDQAMQYFNAFTTDYLGTDFTISITGNVVTITCINGSSIFGATLSAGSSIFATLSVVSLNAIYPLNYADISIEVIDNYVNTLPLVVNSTQINSPVLMYDSGEDITGVFMNSKLNFNMLVSDKSDAKFFHLFTGDEKQFLVKLFGIDTLGTKYLIWQGFLLPDIYKEPYVNGAFFVDFTAVDMLSTLKTKTLKPWFYNNTFPISYTIALLLKETGLSQHMIVAPTILPGDVTKNWHDITVPLAHYDKDGEYKDCLSILNDILLANGLTIHSHRGYWYLTGLTRKGEEINTGCYEYNSSGTFIRLVDVYNRKTTPMQAASTPLISVIPPYKKVIADLSMLNKKNMYTDTVAVADKETSFFISDIPTSEVSGNYLFQPLAVDYTIYPDYPVNVYWTSQIKPWIKVGSLDYLAQLLFGNFILAQFRINYGLDVVTEATALNEYYECPEKPSVEAGVTYKFSFKLNDVNIGWLDGGGNGFNQDALDRGDYDRMAPFQILLNGNEYFAKRPNFTNNAYRYKYSVTPGLAVNKVDFIFEYEFTPTFSGELTFRLLAAINDGLGFLVFDFRYLSELKCVIVKDKSNDKMTGVRAINFTTEEKLDLNFVSAPSEALKNNFGINTPSSLVYIKNLDQNVGAIDDYGTHIFYSNSATPVYKKLFLKVFEIGITDYLRIAYNRLYKNFFSVDTSGNEYSMVSWYLYNNYTSHLTQLAYMYNYDDGINLKEGYRSERVVGTSDGLNYVFVEWPTEDLSYRSSWRIDGITPVDSYNKFNQTLIKAYHYTRAVPKFSLETEYLDILFPNEITEFHFNGIDRVFILPKITIDLTDGKSRVTAVERIFQTLTDITYE